MYLILQSCCLGGKNYTKGDKVELTSEDLKSIEGSESTIVENLDTDKEVKAKGKK